jgi:capsular polysaccharide biosynthesis protein
MDKALLGISYYLRRTMRLLLSHSWSVLEAIAVSAVIASLASRFLMVPAYEATAQIAVRDGNELNDCAAAAKSSEAGEKAIDNLGLSYSVEELADIVKVEVDETTRRVSVTATHGSPLLAHDLANAISEVASGYIVSVSGSDAATIAEYANMPQKPSSPNVRQNTIIGGALGIAVAAVIALMVSILDDSIKSGEDVRHHLGFRTLAVIPPDRRSRRASKAKAAAPLAIGTSRAGQ